MLRRTLLLLLALGGLPASAREQGIALPKPIVLRLSGHFTIDRRRAEVDGADAVAIAVDGVERWFAAVRARTLGDHALDGRDVLAAVAPIRPNLIALGPDDLRRRLLEAPVGAKIELEGLVNRGSRTFLVRSVTTGDPPAAR